MTSFKDRPWHQRVQPGGMGDEAEGHFRTWADHANIGYARYGLDRPRIAVHRLPDHIRYTPDFVCTNQLVEVQGFGRDQTLKDKKTKLNALVLWNQFHPTSMFVWDRTNERRFLVTVQQLIVAAHHPDMETHRFPEGHEYYAFPADLLLEIGTLL